MTKQSLRTEYHWKPPKKSEGIETLAHLRCRKPSSQEKRDKPFSILIDEQIQRMIGLDMLKKNQAKSGPLASSCSDAHPFA